MFGFFKNNIQPLNDKLAEDLGIRKIDVVQKRTISVEYIPSIMESNYTTLIIERNSSRKRYIYQFNPLGYKL